jgi:tagatose-1,6-bisphosphate aldolase non-catalytic subunit AgaZ/GatZ
VPKMSCRKGVGYGSSLNDNSGCQVEVPNSQPCQAQTRDLWQAQPGFWYRFYKGTSGTMQLGVSYSYTHRSTWVGTGIEPKGIENIVITSFRFYLP